MMVRFLGEVTAVSHGLAVMGLRAWRGRSAVAMAFIPTRRERQRQGGVANVVGAYSNVFPAHRQRCPKLVREYCRKGENCLKTYGMDAMARSLL